MKFWPMDKLLVDKYNFSERDALEFSDFLRPLLDFAPEKRLTAGQCLQHPWLGNGDPNTIGESEQAGLENLKISMDKLQMTVGK